MFISVKNVYARRGGLLLCAVVFVAQTPVLATNKAYYKIYDSCFVQYKVTADFLPCAHSTNKI